MLAFVSRRDLSRDNIRAAAMLATLGIVAAGIYFRVVDSPFFFDDYESVIQNPSITNLWPLVAESKEASPLVPPRNIPTSGRPLVNLSLAINYHFGELKSAGYRIFNIVVHALSAMLLGAIVRRTLQLDYFGGRFANTAWPLSLLGALIWMVHPLQTETVAYVTQRTELLVGFFYLATLYCSLRYWTATQPIGRRVWVTCAAMSCVAGMACKEVMVSAPIIVLLFDRTFLAGSLREAWRRSWPLYLGLAAGWMLLYLLNISGPRSKTAGFHLEQVSPTQWWCTQAEVLLMYLGLVIWPWPLVIRYHVSEYSTIATAWPAVLVVAILVATTLFLLWRNRSLGFLLAWIWLLLAPTLVVPIWTEVAAERRMYLPLAALTVIAVVGGHAIVRRMTSAVLGASRSHLPDVRPIAVTVVAFLSIAIVLGAVSVRRLAAYESELTLWQDTVIHEPDDPMTQFNLGNTLLKRDRPQEAVEHLKIALKLNPKNADAHNSLGAAHLQLGQADEAAQQFAEALRKDASIIEAHNNLGTLMRESRRYDDALAHFKQVLELDSNSFEARNGLGHTLLDMGRLSEAVEQLQAALEVNPDFVPARNNLGNALMKLGREREAIEHYRHAIQFRPGQADIHSNLGLALMATGQLDEARKSFDEVVRLRPNNLGDWSNLATANARLNRSAEAIAAGEKALELARAQGLTDVARQFEEWLASIKANHFSPAGPSGP